jgi:hypothetical protein
MRDETPTQTTARLLEAIAHADLEVLPDLNALEPLVDAPPAIGNLVPKPDAASGLLVQGGQVPVDQSGVVEKIRRRLGPRRP